MKRFLLKVFGFGIGAFVLFLILILATEIDEFSEYLPMKAPIIIDRNSHQWTRQREADTTRNVDVLIVGSSLAQSIDVREFRKFNLRAFNLGSGSQSPIQTQYLFDKYLDSFNPKLLIWDVHPYTFANRGVESTVDLLSNCQDCGGMLPLLFKTNSSLAWNSYLKRMLLKPFENKDVIVPKESKLSKYFYGGYMEVYLKAPKNPVQIDQFEYQGLNIQLSTFKSELNSLQKRGIPVILVYSPRSAEFIASFQNQQEWMNYYRALVDQGLAENFLNFNELFSADEHRNFYFYDIAHLTHAGARNYNKVLISSISERLKVINQAD